MIISAATPVKEGMNNNSLRQEDTSISSRIQEVQVGENICAWLLEDYTVPIIALEFSFYGGAAQDRPGKAGTAALMAALLDEGAGEYDIESFQKALEESAIEFSFSASRDYVTGRVKTLLPNLAKAFDLLALAVQVPRFDTEARQRVQSQTLASLRREMNDPDSRAYKAWREAAFPNHPYGCPVHGSLESVPQISEQDIRLHHANLFVQENLKLGVVGAINAAELQKGLQKVFGPLPLRGILSPIPGVEKIKGGETLIDLNVSQATIRFGFSALPRHDPDYMAAVVVNHILGGGVFSARLFREIREKRGLAYSISCSLDAFQHAALLTGSTTTKNESASEALALIRAEINSLAEQGPSLEELEAAKKYLIGSYGLRFDTSTKIAHWLVHTQQEGFPRSYFRDRNAWIAAISLEDTQRAAKRLFADKEMLTCIVGRPGSAAL